MSVVVIGASLAGFSLVRELRARGYGESITVVGDEVHAPYDRPPLSKEFLRDEVDLALGAIGDDPGTRWILGHRAVEINRATAGPGVTLDDGTVVTGRSLVLATGARARPLPGAPALDGIHTLRTVDDARAIRASLRAARAVVIVGAGLIGSEIASTAAALGVQVTVVELAAAPLAGVFGPLLGALCADLHAANGVHLRTGVAVAEFRGRGRVEAVRLTDGTVMPADTVIVGIGATPNTEWAQHSGLRIDNGFLTDSRCRTSIPGIYAIGDCARAYHDALGGHHRSEHWSNATAQARIAAAAVLGAPADRAPTAYFWSKQYGHMIQFAGEHRAGDTLRFLDGDPSAPSCTALYERDGEPVAVFAIDNARLFTRYRKQIERRPAAVAAP
ncbi:NAD(P)/FAD-dependent oxidoreductase [Nocardia brasiliensis]|uniref:NAD(P)/FAD-dependent oxidoreductase n=1 Tax=Nocardia brasiliensis TaxID=37326 RepID=UPI0004A6B909|nr:FAD-dependent oxidoreductase [Nocardia brasiliensis]